MRVSTGPPKKAGCPVPLSPVPEESDEEGKGDELTSVILCLADDYISREPSKVRTESVDYVFDGPWMGIGSTSSHVAIESKPEEVNAPTQLTRREDFPSLSAYDTAASEDVRTKRALCLARNAATSAQERPQKQPISSGPQETNMMIVNSGDMWERHISGSLRHKWALRHCMLSDNRLTVSRMDGSNAIPVHIIELQRYQLSWQGEPRVLGHLFGFSLIPDHRSAKNTSLSTGSKSPTHHFAVASSEEYRTWVRFLEQATSGGSFSKVGPWDHP